MDTTISLQDVIHSDPEIMHGTPVFKSTRVPVQALLDHLEAGDSLEVFLEDFPTVAGEQAVALIELAAREAFAKVGADRCQTGLEELQEQRAFCRRRRNDSTCSLRQTTGQLWYHRCIGAYARRLEACYEPLEPEHSR